jgi:hypothetical protein
MRRKNKHSYSKNYEKSRNYTSFFTEESLVKRVEEINESINQEASFQESKTPNDNSNILKDLDKTEISPAPKPAVFRKKKPVKIQEPYNSEESFDMEEDENKIDLPFQEDELYSNILMEFLPKLKQEIVANKVQRRRSDITTHHSIREYFL